MREITAFTGGKFSKELAEICLNAKTAAAWAAQEFEDEAKQKYSKIFILSEEKKGKNTLLGFCALRFVCESAEITNFAISPAYQRKHLGSKLFEYCLAFLKNNGVKNVTLEVSSANIKAQEFYKKFKFTCVNVRKKFYNMGEDALLLKLDL